DTARHEIEHAWQQRRHRPAMRRQHALDGAEVADHGLADHALEEGELVVEVEVDRGLAEPGALGDVVEPGAGEALFDKQLERGLEDLLGPFGGGAALFLGSHGTNLLVSNNVFKVQRFPFPSNEKGRPAGLPGHSTRVKIPQGVGRNWEKPPSMLAA